jgi:hypothetical protein
MKKEITEGSHWMVRDIILENEITPPVYAKKDYEKIQEGEAGRNKNEYLNTKIIKTKTGLWRKDRYIIGKRTPDDKQYCERVDPLDILSTTEIRKYITAVEVFLSKKEDLRSADEQQGRMLKYIIFFGLGMSVILWALYAGAISFPNI